MSQMRLDDQEIEFLTQQIAQILNYAARVQEAIGTTTSEDAHNINVFRSDEIIPTPTQPILAQAPEREEDYFVVPRILEHK